jgi:hypothetical protein
VSFEEGIWLTEAIVAGIVVVIFAANAFRN